MKIVIKLDDNIYGLLKRTERLFKYIDEEDDTVETALMKAVADGTPLPKGHGRLIDADELHHKMGEWLKPQKADESVMVALDDIAISTMMEIEDAPTIIERSESE